MKPVARAHRLRGRAGEALLLVAIVAFGGHLRFEPVRLAGGPARVELDFDPAFHLRMAAVVRDHGALPELDPLGFPPAGRPVAALLPTLLYPTLAGFERALRTLGIDVGIQTSALYMTAILGGLIALPVWGVARGLGLGPGAALLAALFAAVTPAHVHRTAAHWVRYDALGSLLLVAHAGAVTLALAARRGRVLIGASACAAVALALALAVWRVAILALALEALFLLGLFLTRRLRTPHLIAFAPTLAAGLAASLAIPYLLAGPFLLSRTGALVFLTLGLLLADAATALHAVRSVWGHATRIGLVGGILAVSLFLAAPSPADRLGDALGWKLGRHPAGPAAALLATATELESPRLAHLLAPDYFSALGPCALLFALGRRFPRRRPALTPPAPGAESGLRFWHGATALLFVATLVFARNKVLLGPFLALYPALLWRGLRGRRSVALRRIGLGLLLGAAVLTCADAFRLTRILPVRLDPDDRRALTWLRSAAHPGDVLLGDWGRGYAVEWHGGLASATDGLLEVPGMAERIAAFGHALYAEDPRPLAELCRQVGARFLWVPGDKRRVHALYAGLDPTVYFDGPRVTARGGRTVFARLLRGEPLPGIRPQFRAGAQVLCAVIPDSLPPPAGLSLH
jgi:asparagine N-glycosylation enzyme membrane subunit Stt3